MKKETFKKLRLMSLLLVITAVSVSAQSSRSKTISIPFSFTVGEHSRLESTELSTTEGTLTRFGCESRDGHISALFSTIPTWSMETQEKGKLVFRRFGDQYFLSEICMAGDNSGRELLMPRVVRELARTTIDREILVVAFNSPNRN